MGEIESLIMLFLKLEVIVMLQLKLWSARGVSQHPAIMSNCDSHVYRLIHPVDEFFFKQVRTWAQCKISSCRLCIWCKSRE